MASLLLLFCFTNALFGVTAQDLAPPTLTAHPSVITKAESVTLNCRPPPSVSAPVSLCHFYTTDGQNWQNSRCLQSVRGSDLLTVKQKPPVQVKVQCYYVVEWGQAVSTSDHSDPTPVTVHLQSMKPGISLQALMIQRLLFPALFLLLQLAPNVTCILENPHSHILQSTQGKETEERLFCQFYVSKMDFVSNFHKVQSKVVSCDFTLGNGSISLSPRSEQKDLTVYMIKYYPDLLHVTSSSIRPRDDHRPTT
ncbi:hypothetical protein NL108_015309 [Boleophthalmus pectinirostris]|nr:hypothetical protein NL108_015309 [Boleophthalmus pectinirostris]